MLTGIPPSSTTTELHCGSRGGRSRWLKHQLRQWISQELEGYISLLSE
jgi:hypothetical protein